MDTESSMNTQDEGRMDPSCVTGDERAFEPPTMASALGAQMDNQKRNALRATIEVAAEKAGVSPEDMREMVEQGFMAKGGPIKGPAPVFVSDKECPYELNAPDCVPLQPDPTTKDTNPKDGIGSLKPSYAAVPVPVLYELGAALTEGARKYGGYNWRVAGVRLSVYIDAARRHLDSFWEGEDDDPDSGLSHITKAIASLVVLRDAQIQGMLANDDRPPRTEAPYMAEGVERMAVLAQRYPNAVPNYTQEQIHHKRVTPVSIYAGQTLGFEIEVMLPADDAPEGFTWMQQGPRRTDLDHTLAVAQALRDDGYGQRVIRVTRVADRMEQMADSTEWVAGEMRVPVTTIFPGDASLMEATEEEVAGYVDEAPGGSIGIPCQDNAYGESCPCDDPIETFEDVPGQCIGDHLPGDFPLDLEDEAGF